MAVGFAVVGGSRRGGWRAGLVWGSGAGLRQDGTVGWHPRLGQGSITPQKWGLVWKSFHFSWFCTVLLYLLN